MNCRGLGDVSKRRDVFNYLRQSHSNIYCLQDTLVIEKDCNSIRNLWGFECYVCGNRSDARGIIILINNNFQYQEMHVKRDPGGNFIILSLQIENTIFTIVSLYGPNNDDPIFYDTITDELTSRMI